jgi:hypothetical protein
MKQKQWGFIRETTAEAIAAGIDKDTGICRTGLEEYLAVIFPNKEWIHNKSCGVRNVAGHLIRPDYRFEELKLIIEVDGTTHYRYEEKIKTDVVNSKLYENAGYKVVRIPYFIQLSNNAIRTLFGVDVQEPMFDETVPSMGPKGKNTPATICELGIKRMAREFLAFPEQYETNVKALKSVKDSEKTGVYDLEKEYNMLKNSTKVLYHASVKPYRIGSTISVDDYEGETTRFYQSLNNTQKSVEEQLDSVRPQENISRKKCIFFFADPVMCKYFAKLQYPKENIYIYEVAVKDYCGGFPMHIIGRLESLIHNGEDVSTQIKEYWNPTKKWNCLEYLGREMIVLKDVSNAECRDALTPIMNDRDTYNKLFQKKQIQDTQVNLEDFLNL